MIVESVAWSASDCLAAQQAGADRIELVSSIEVGGLTPSIGLVRHVLASCSLPVMAMIRPRPGHFAYSESEVSTMESDIEALLAEGARGFVFGVLEDDGKIDATACQRLVRRCGDAETVFHRAFDLTTDPVTTLIDLGFSRVLTTGRAATAIEGAAEIRALRDQAGSAIEVLVGGGIRSGNVRKVLDLTGATQIHLAPTKRLGLTGGTFGEGYPALDATELQAVVREAKEEAAAQKG
jgi:copper homeostasis protein